MSACGMATTPSASPTIRSPVAMVTPPTVTGSPSRPGVVLAGADDAVVAGEDREAEIAQLVAVADAAVNKQAGDASLLCGHGQHLAPVAVAGAADVDDQHGADGGGYDGVVQG